MRLAPSLSSRRAEGVSSQRVRRPTRSDTSSPSAAARASAWRADFSVTPNPARVSTSIHVQTGRPAGSTNSPSTVISRDLALVCRTSRRRMTSGGRPASSAVIGRLPPPWPEPLVAASGYGTPAFRAAGHARRGREQVWSRPDAPTGQTGADGLARWGPRMGGPADGTGSPARLCGYVRTRSGQVGGVLYRRPGAGDRRPQPDGSAAQQSRGRGPDPACDGPDRATSARVRGRPVRRLDRRRRGGPGQV